MPYDNAIEEKNYFYVILIDKEEYLKNNCNNLFIIPPFSALTQAFGQESLYHATSKVAMNQVPDHEILVDGAEWTYDEAGILLIQRNPLEQAYLFADFLSKNVRLIKKPNMVKNVTLQSEEKRLRDNLAKASKFYKEFLHQEGEQQKQERISSKAELLDLLIQAKLNDFSTIRESVISRLKSDAMQDITIIDKISDNLIEEYFTIRRGK